MEWKGAISTPRKELSLSSVTAIKPELDSTETLCLLLIWAEKETPGRPTCKEIVDTASRAPCQSLAKGCRERTEYEALAMRMTRLTAVAVAYQKPVTDGLMNRKETRHKGSERSDSFAS